MYMLQNKEKQNMEKDSVLPVVALPFFQCGGKATAVMEFENITLPFSFEPKAISSNYAHVSAANRGERIAKMIAAGTRKPKHSDTSIIENNYSAVCTANRAVRMAKMIAAGIRKPKQLDTTIADNDSTALIETKKRRGPKPKYFPNADAKMTTDDIRRWQMEQRKQRNRQQAMKSFDCKKLGVKQLEQQILEYTQKIATIQRQIKEIQKNHQETPVYTKIGSTGRTIQQEHEWACTDHQQQPLDLGDAISYPRFFAATPTIPCTKKC